MDNFESVTTRPVIKFDVLGQWDALHILNEEGNEKIPILVIINGNITVYKAEGNYVFMTLRAYSTEYLFTCANPQEAHNLSNRLAQYSRSGQAVSRVNFNYLFPII